MNDTPRTDALVRELQRIKATDWTIDLIALAQALERDLTAALRLVACTQPPERPKCKHPANDVCLNCDTGYAAANRGAK